MASDAGKLSFSSQFRYERIALKGSFAFTTGTVFPNVVKTYTVAHNLGYAPFFKLFYGFGDGKYFELSTGPASSNVDGNGFQIDNAYADTVNITVVVDNSAAVTPISGTIYYRIYAEQQV